MLRTIVTLGCMVSVLVLAVAKAELYEVKMLNRGKAGPMIFEPDFLELKKGDRVKFLVTHKSHNAATIPEMMPEGGTVFKGQIDEQIEISFDVEGYYGIQCIPHYQSGMVMIINVGETELPQEFVEFKAPGLADKRFKEIMQHNGLID